MLINFFYTLRAAKLPVSVKEYLTLLEALKAMAPEARFVMTSETISGAQTLYDAGAHWVHIPRLHDAVHLARVVREAKESDLADLRRLERDALAARREVLD